MKVRDAAILRARPRILSAEISLKPAGPVGRLRDTVLGAEKIVAEAIEAGAVAREEIRVVQALDDQRVREREHQRGIAMRARRDPFGVEERGRIVAHRADIAELDARGL